MGDTKSIGIAYRDQDLTGATLTGCTLTDSTLTDSTLAGSTSYTPPAIFDAVTIGATAGTAAFFGVTPDTQPTDAAQAALTLTTATTAGFGFSTSAGFNAFIAQLENIRASLVTLGLLKGS